MSHFLGELDTRLIDEKKGLHRLLAPFGFWSNIAGEPIMVPVGFVTDFASVPRIIGAWLLYGGKGVRAAVIHDWLYSTQAYSRAVCDVIFEEALKASKYKDWEVAGMYAGVRIGGWVAWTKKNVPQEPSVQHEMDREAS